jgi:hypothetical protein
MGGCGLWSGGWWVVAAEMENGDLGLLLTLYLDGRMAQKYHTTPDMLA